MATYVTYADLDEGYKQVQTIEDGLHTTITTMGSQPTTADLLSMQKQMQQWSMMVDLVATLAKTLSETMKSVIQKSG